MEAIFLKILNMSLSAAIVTVVVCLIRLCLRGAPKRWSYFLWSAVGFRLAVPVSLRSVFSVFRLAPLRPTAGTDVVFIPADAILAAQPQPGTADVTAAASTVAGNALTSWIWAAGLVWCVGAAALLLWGACSYILLRRQLVGAVRVEDGVWETDRIRVPFLLGLFRPRIYIPLGLDGEIRDYVLAHERYHIRRGDHWVKCLSFLLLTVHWFNPFVWLAFCLMGRDMEMSCDEKVLSHRENSAKPYSLSLLSFAAVRRFPSPTPLAFGETGVRQRIQNALRWKKPRRCVSVTALLLCLAVLAACATDPVALTPSGGGNDLTFSEPFLTWMGKTQGDMLTAGVIREEDIGPDSRDAAGLKEPVVVDGLNYRGYLRFDPFAVTFDREAYAEDLNASKDMTLFSVRYVCRSEEEDLTAQIARIRDAMTEAYGEPYQSRFAEYRYDLTDYISDPTSAGIAPDWEIDEYGNEYRTGGTGVGEYADLWIVAENPDYPAGEEWEANYVTVIVSLLVMESCTDITVYYRVTQDVPEVYGALS